METLPPSAKLVLHIAAKRCLAGTSQSGHRRVHSKRQHVNSVGRNVSADETMGRRTRHDATVYFRSSRQSAAGTQLSARCLGRPA